MIIDPLRTRWFKSSYSESGGQCVEIAFLPSGFVGVRDSKRPDAGALVFGADDWSAFTAAVRDGSFG